MYRSKLRGIEPSEIKANNYKHTNIKYELAFNKYENEKLCLQEIIRPIHGLRSELMITSENIDLSFLIPEKTNISFSTVVGKICRAHSENFEWISSNIKRKDVLAEFGIILFPC